MFDFEIRYKPQSRVKRQMLAAFSMYVRANEVTVREVNHDDLTRTSLFADDKLITIEGEVLEIVRH